MSLNLVRELVGFDYQRGKEQIRHTLDGSLVGQTLLDAWIANLYRVLSERGCKGTS